MVYYISDEAWSGLGGVKLEERIDSDKPFSTGAYDVKENIIKHYEEWLNLHFRIADDRLREFVENREAQKGGRKVFDGTVGRLTTYSLDYPRWKRRFTLPPEVELALAQWTVREQVWRRSRTASTTLLCGIALEMIGRGWITHGERTS